MSKSLIFLVLLLTFSVTLQAEARDNPFISKKSEKDSSIKLPAVATKIIGKIMMWQQELNTKLTERVKSLKNDKSLKNIFPLILISFLYGIAHAAGPGHGKVVIFSYFISQKGNIKKGMFLGFLIGLFHAVSGIIIVLSLYFIIKTTYLASFENISRHIKIISYTLVMLVGLFILINSLFNITDRLFKKNNKDTESKESNKKLLPIALAVGIVPCPGVVIIMLFALSFNLLYIGLAMSLLMALGMGITIMIAGFISILGRKGLVKSTAGKQKVQHYFQKGLTIFGSLLITLFGVTLLLGAV
ncbi:MAG: hypothetical protein PVG39_01745 [Desulfobacteraceae bacterium]|jgi:ABC-type nickel/cobalt efflux system permease component RcnA